MGHFWKTILVAAIAMAPLQPEAIAEDADPEWAVEFNYWSVEFGELRVTVHSSGTVMILDQIRRGRENREPRNIIVVTQCPADDLEIVKESSRAVINNFRPRRKDRREGDGDNWLLESIRNGKDAHVSRSDLTSVPWSEDRQLQKFLKVVDKLYRIEMIVGKRD